MADKRVESLRVPCLDAGSTPATSTPRRSGFAPGRLFWGAGHLRSETPSCPGGRPRRDVRLPGGAGDSPDSKPSRRIPVDRRAPIDKRFRAEHLRFIPFRFPDLRFSLTFERASPERLQPDRHEESPEQPDPRPSGAGRTRQPRPPAPHAALAARRHRIPRNRPAHSRRIARKIQCTRTDGPKRNSDRFPIRRLLVSRPDAAYRHSTLRPYSQSVRMAVRHDPVARMRTDAVAPAQQCGFSATPQNPDHRHRQLRATEPRVLRTARLPMFDRRRDRRESPDALSDRKDRRPFRPRLPAHGNGCRSAGRKAARDGRQRQKSCRLQLDPRCPDAYRGAEPDRRQGGRPHAHVRHRVAARCREPVRHRRRNAVSDRRQHASRPAACPQPLSARSLRRSRPEAGDDRSLPPSVARQKGAPGLRIRRRGVAR